MATQKKLVYADDVRNELLKHDPKLSFVIERVKGVDAVEAVRCKDCVFCKLYSESGEYHCRTMEGMYRAVKPNDFCSYGERNENG